MESVKDIENQIVDSESQLNEVRKKIKDAEGRLRDAKAGSEKVKADLQSLKEKRQGALAAGQDSSSLNASIKKLADDAELKADEIIGLEGLLKELQSTEANLTTKPEGLRRRVLQLESISLAQRYNELSEQLAGVARGLNEINFKIDSSGYQGKAQRVVFLPEDFISNIPRAFFDESGLVLEDFVERYKGKYHSNIHCPDCEKYFYKWDAHRQDLINNK